MNPPRNLIGWALLHPQATPDLSGPSWDLLIRQGRRTTLLARLRHILEQRRLLDRIPPYIKRHLDSDQKYAEKLDAATRWEVQCIMKALKPLDCPVVFLKGAAYLLAGDPAAAGRLFSDIDILVPKNRIDEVERALKKAGWVGSHQNEYDQRYYREWMHELPPMIHLKRQTNLDVHYNILPEVGRVCPDAAQLFERSIRLGDGPVRILCAEDRIIHSAVHLFYNGELDQGPRDLSDIDLLLRHHCTAEGFWERLVTNAEALGVGRSLFYAMHYARIFYGTPVPASVMTKVADSGPQLPGSKCMDFLFMRALMPDHPSCDDRFTGLARWALFVRAHWLRMPPALLLRHLYKKTWIRWKSRGYLK